MALATVILAAGKGKRMNNPDKSKVMFELNGKPMIEYVVKLALDIGSERIVLIVGHQRESVMEFIRARFADEMTKISFAVQEEQLGTGHAVIQAREALEGFNGNVLILSGDVPLLQRGTVEKLIDAQTGNNWTASLISGVAENPFGYGRIIRDTSGAFVSIREEKDADESEKLIREINSGIYLADSRNLFEALSTIKTDNKQGEYYLTDIFSYFVSIGAPIGAVPTENTLEISGVNTVEQLQELESSALNIRFA